MLQVAVESPTYETAKYGDAALVDAVATRDAETGDVALFAVNRSLTETVTLEVDARSLPGLRVVEATTLANPDHTWSATADDDTSVRAARQRDRDRPRRPRVGRRCRRCPGTSSGWGSDRRASRRRGGCRRSRPAWSASPPVRDPEADPAATALSLSGDIHTHDPALVVGAEGEPWYVFSTGDVRKGLGAPQIRRSTDDGLTWELVGTVWDAETRPEWAYEAVPGVSNFWAPEVIEHDGTFYLYYSASTFGSNTSAIGLTTNTTLDPDDPDYAWVDQGEVLAVGAGGDRLQRDRPRRRSRTRTARRGWRSARSGAASSWSS